MPPRILVTGSIAYDVLLGYDGSFQGALAGQNLASLSVSFFAPHYARHHGGTGANIAWNLNLLRQSPLLLGTVGSDGGAYVALLEERGVDVGRIEVLQNYPTATAIIGTDSDERQIAFFHPGADTHGSIPDLADDRDDIAVAIVSARDGGLMLQAVRQCQTLAIPYFFDPGQQVIGLSGDELLVCARGSAGVVMNEYEWGIFCDKIRIPTDEFLTQIPVAVVTLGEEGVALHSAAGTVELPACTAERVVNPTGAGDGFRAGLLTGIALGWSLQQSAQLGASVGSFIVEHEGTLLDTLDLDEVRERAKRAYKESLPELSVG